MKPTAGAVGGTILVRLTSPGVYLPHRLAAVGAFTLFDQSFLVCYGAGGHLFTCILGKDGAGVNNMFPNIPGGVKSVSAAKFAGVAVLIFSVYASGAG